jgi:hypothetical protein
VRVASARAAVALAFAVTTLFGCFFSPRVEPEDCALQCSRDECPEGYQCKEVREGVGYCVELGSPSQCLLAAKQPELPPGVETGPEVSGHTAGGRAEVRRFAEPCARSGVLQITPCPLPPPCRGAPYTSLLRATGGREPYTWSAEPAAGVELENTGRIRGTVHFPATWTVHVMDAAGALGEATFELSPRDSCWFGFVDGALGARRLTLVDPLAEAGSEAAIRLPDTADTSLSVVDFRFSPDGRRLAVRVEVAGRRHLVLFEAPLWAPLGSTKPGASIEEYAWAPKDPLLAVAGEHEGERFLSAVRVLGADVATTGSRLRMEPEVPAPATSPLTWFGELAIAFHSGAGLSAPSHRVYGGQLGASGFVVTPFDGASYSEDADTTISLIAGGRGFLAVSRAVDATSIDRYALVDGALARTTHRPNLSLSPSGRYLALAEGGRLQIYMADEDRIDPLEGYPVPIVVGDGCEVVLAWSPDDRRIACATDGLPGPGLRLFRFRSDNPREGPVAEPSLNAIDVEGSELYSAALSRRRRRGFSPDGRWFSFSTDHELHAVDLFEERLQLRQAPARFESVLTRSDFIPSPDGESLLAHQGAWLSHHSMRTLSEGSAVTSAQLDAPRPCSEGETLAERERGSCGSGSTRSTQVAWSPDSRAIAFRTADSELLLTRIREAGREDRLSVECDIACVEASAFQPAAPY